MPRKQRRIVIALGGNAISPPRGDLGFATERQLIDQAAVELAALAASGLRLLVVHGNGPQVGRLLATPEGGGQPGSTAGSGEELDIRVAQTQGELGYLLVEALARHLGADRAVAVVTRVLVDAGDTAFDQPTKPIGPVLRDPPVGVASAHMPDGSGWRRVVASPRPVAVLEQAAIAELLRSHHVVAGGGGGVPLSVVAGARRAQSAVVDKDWVAGLLATALHADILLFVTDVSHVFDDFGGGAPRRIDHLTIAEAQARLDAGSFAAGSMAPKVQSAVHFVCATARPAVITTLGSISAALEGKTGTRIGPRC